MSDAYIPGKTVEKLQTPVQKGGRHHAAIEIAIPLIGNGLPNAAVFATLRSKFEADVSDKELHDIITWVRKRNPTPSTPSAPNRQPYTPTPQAKSRTPLEQCDWWTNGARMTPEEMTGLSPMEIPPEPVEYSLLALSSLYQGNDHLNIVCKFIQDGEKARPCGGGKTMTRDGWLSYLQKEGIPQSQAGAWFRPNPCALIGTGADGAIQDCDITGFKFVLLESDTLPIEVQCALFHRLRLPIAAVVRSGGDSVHAWARIEANTLQGYKDTAKRLLDVLKPYGIDPANSNASRLSRFPGAVRVIGAKDGGEQALLWLNPDVTPLTLEGVQAFERSLEYPFTDAFPLKQLADQAVSRYEDMAANRGKLGVPTGIPDFDRISGGLKKGHSIVIAGQTGGGNTTLALHFIISALQAGYGVLLFSLEMDKEEIFDLLMSNLCTINRNVFNNGEFSAEDIGKMTVHLKDIKNMRLYIEDSALSGPEQIKNRVMQLKADGYIGLVVVDYIQFVNPGLSKEGREQQVAAISHALRTVARESHLPMVILSQINDEGKLRESRVIAHNANVVMLVECSDTSDDFKVRIVKGRGVPKEDYDMIFERRYGRLRPAEKIQPRDYQPD